MTISNYFLIKVQQTDAVFNVTSCLNQNKADFLLTAVWLTILWSLTPGLLSYKHTSVSLWWLVRSTLNHTKVVILYQQGCTQREINSVFKLKKWEPGEARKTFKVLVQHLAASWGFQVLQSEEVWSGMVSVEQTINFRRRPGWKDRDLLQTESQWKRMKNTSFVSNCQKKSWRELKDECRRSSARHPGGQWGTPEVLVCRWASANKGLLKYRLLTGEAILFSNSCSFCIHVPDFPLFS